MENFRFIVGAFIFIVFSGFLCDLIQDKNDNHTDIPKVTIEQKTIEEKAREGVEKQRTNSTNKKAKEFYAGVVLAHSLWIEDKRYLYDYTDGFKSGDKEFLLQMVREGKAYFVKKNTGVVFSGTYEKGEIIKIRFFEGRYKNKSGYIWADFVQKIDIDK